MNESLATKIFNADLLTEARSVLALTDDDERGAAMYALCHKDGGFEAFIQAQSEHTLLEKAVENKKRALGLDEGLYTKIVNMSRTELRAELGYATTLHGDDRKKALAALSLNPFYEMMLSEVVEGRRRADMIAQERERIENETPMGIIDIEADPLASWKPRTLRDAYAPRSPTEYVVEGIFKLPSLNIVYAPPGAFKSMIILDMAMQVVQGLPWLGRETKRSPIVWVDIDNGQRRTDDRFQMVGKGHSVPVDAPVYYYSMQVPLLNAGDNHHMESLKKRITDVGAKLVIIDNLVASSGGIDENTAQMMMPMTNWRLLVENTGVCIIIIHHRNKTKDVNRSGDALRGFSGIEGAIDLALYIQRADVHAKKVIVKSTKTRDKDVLPFAAEFNYIDNEEGITTAAWFESINLEDAGAAAATLTSTKAAIIKILETVGPEGMGQRRLAEKAHAALKASGCTMGLHSIEDVLKAMAEDGELYAEPTTNSVRYSLQKRLGLGDDSGD
jgi:hypothetical protein